jgi:hypothetical protein
MIGVAIPAIGQVHQLPLLQGEMPFTKMQISVLFQFPHASRFSALLITKLFLLQISWYSRSNRRLDRYITSHDSNTTNAELLSNPVYQKLKHPSQ